MTASGFRAFFPNGVTPAPAEPTNSTSHLHHLLPNMRFLAQKLEAPNYLPNFPTNGGVIEDENEEVSTSNLSAANGGLTGHSVEVTNDSGKRKPFINRCITSLANRCTIILICRFLNQSRFQKRKSIKSTIFNVQVF